MSEEEKNILSHSLDLLDIENTVKELTVDNIEKTKESILKQLDKANTSLLKSFKISFPQKERERAFEFRNMK